MLVKSLLSALNEVTVARAAGTEHDNARMAFTSFQQRVDTYEEFEDLVGDYVVYHHERCVSPGGRLAREKAIGMAEIMLDQSYRREGGNKLTAFQDARDGTNGGVRVVLDRVADAFKGEAAQLYTRRVFANHVSPENWEGKVALIREFLDLYGQVLGPSIDRENPERYAKDYEELVLAYVDGLRRTSSMFRSN